MYQICRREHDMIVDLKVAILSTVNEMGWRERTIFMPRLFDVFDSIPVINNNFVDSKCKECRFPNCKIGKMLSSTLTWVKSGNYKECGLECCQFDPGSFSCSEKENGFH